MMKNYIFFGSSSSNDYDILVFVDTIPSIEKSKLLIEKYEKLLKRRYTNKPLNINLAVLKKGTIVSVFKGTSDEVNNSVYHTYDLHNQVMVNPVKNLVQRNHNLKHARTLRVILSFYSRLELREKVKNALRGTVKDKIETLRLIDLTLKIDDFNKKENVRDVYKTIAFQLGQSCGLIDNVELYTKEDIVEQYGLKSAIYRKEINQTDLELMQTMLNRIIEVLETSDILELKENEI